MIRTAVALAALLALSLPARAQVLDWEDEWYLTTDDDCELYVVEFGRGEPLVALHGGWGAEHGYLLDAFQGLFEAYRIVFYDQRGSLRSPCPEGEISVERHVADLERLRAELGLERMVLVGHSMGTFLAMSYLQAHPDRVDGLVLLGALVPRTPADDEETALYREQEGAFVRFVERREVEEVLRAEGLDREEDLSDRERTHRWRIHFAAANTFHVDRWRRMKGGQVFYNAEAGRAAGRTMPQSWDFTGDLERLGRPVTVINGDHDLVGFTGRLHRRMLDPIGNVELVLLENAGHNAWIDRPEAFRTELERALAKYD